MYTNLTAAPLNDLLADVQSCLKEINALISLVTVFDVARVSEEISLSRVSDLHLERLALEVVRRKYLNMAAVCVFERIFQKIYQDLLESNLVALEACWKLAVLPLQQARLLVDLFIRSWTVQEGNGFEGQLCILHINLRREYSFHELECISRRKGLYLWEKYFIFNQAQVECVVHKREQQVDL